MTEFLSAFFGAVLGFFGSVSLWWVDRRRQRVVARMIVATDLRQWVDRASAEMADMRNWGNSDGAIGATHGQLPEFPFEKSLERVGTVDYGLALKIFELIRQKDSANVEISFERDIGDGEDAHLMWRAHCALVWFETLTLYEEFAARLKWSERIVSDATREMMREEERALAKRKSNLTMLRGVT
jgi:hypothetical protein